MGSPLKKSAGGNVHRIREFELEKVNLAEEFDILQIVGEGWFGKILLVEHRATDTEMVLKALPKAYSSLRDFYREFHYGLHLSTHRNVVTTYDVAFETAGFFVFSQEYAPLGDLTSNVTDNGIGELHTKRVARQIAAALDHLHARELVHRDVKLDNILVFKSDFSRVKLCDFGETRRAGSIVRRRNEWLSYAPPEVLQTDTDDNYKAVTSHDVWQFGIVVFICLTGCLPWQKAASDDPRFQKFLSWHSSALSPIRKQPKLFKLVSSRGQRLFRKLLEPKPEKRPPGLTEIHRYFDDRWMAKGNTERKGTENIEEDGLCPSMYSFHSSPEEKNKLLFSLMQYGIETTVDRVAKKDRIRAWIQNSVIEEEDEGMEDHEEAASTSVLTEEEEENIALHDNETGPAGERIHNRGPIEARRLSTSSKLKQAIVPPPVEPKRITPKLTEAFPAAPPRKHERRHHRVLNEDTRSKTYTPPIDPTIPLSKQQQIIPPLNNGNARPAVSTSDQQINYRNPNAFLVEQNTQPSNSTTHLPPVDVNTSKYDPYRTNYSSAPNITTQIPQDRPKQGQPTINNPVNIHPMQISPTPLNNPIKDTLPASAIPNLSTPNPHTGVPNALAKSALVALSGVQVQAAARSENDPTKVEPPKRIISEKELDRNYNIYGINTKNFDPRQKRLPVVSSPVSGKSFDESRQVAFRGATHRTGTKD